MSIRTSLCRAVAGLAVVGLPRMVAAQEQNPVQRVASIVSVAVEEYGKGVDKQGRLISADEYQEAVDFLKDARNSASRLPRERAVPAGAVLDSIIAAVDAKRPPAVLEALSKRFSAVLGSEAALELPSKPLDVAEGGRLYKENCATCHGERGLGDGPSAATLNPKPPAIGDAKAMYGVTPAMIYRKTAVGVTGTAMPAFASKLSTEQRWNIVMYLGSLHRGAQQVVEGEGLYFQSCTSCHGVTGAANASVSRALSTLPPELSSFSWQVERSDSQMVAAIRDGKPTSPMPSSQLTPAQTQSLVAYLRTMPMRPKSFADAPADSGSANAAARNSLALLEQALTAARSGQRSDAVERALDAYLAFEPIETPARARNPGVVSSMERLYTEFKVAAQQNDLRGAQRARDAIEASMPKVVDLTKPAGSGWEAFFQSFLIILREGFEAILVLGAVVAFLLKTGHRERLKSIWMGVGAALVASGLTAVLLRTVLKAIPASAEMIEGITLLVAVGVLFSVSYWLISRVEAAKWQQFIREKVTTALNHGGGRALAFVAFLAVYREGAETALFYQALFSEGPHVVLPISLGIVVGFGALAIIFTLFYRFGVKIPLRPFFSVTSVLLYYMAFVFMGTGVRELQEGNFIPITPIPGLPTVTWLGFHPTWQTVLAQFVLLALFVFAVAKTFWPKRSVTLPTMVAEPAAPAVAPQQLQRLESENAELEARLAMMESDNADLRARLVALEATLGSPTPTATRRQ